MSNSIIGNFETDGYVICRGIVTPQEISEMRAEILSNLQYGFQNSGGISIPDFIHYKDAFRLTSALKDNQMITSILQNRIFKTNDFRFCGHNDIGINRIVG